MAEDDILKCLKTIYDFLNVSKIDFDEELPFWRNSEVEVKATEELQKDEIFKDYIAGE